MIAFFSRGPVERNGHGLLFTVSVTSLALLTTANCQAEAAFGLSREPSYVNVQESSASGALAIGKAAAGAQLYSHGDPTAEEQLMLELINRTRKDPAGEAARFSIDLNEGIATDPLSPTPKQPLAFNANILQAARLHSTWMLDHDEFSHFEANKDPGQRMTDAGYNFVPPYTYGENIAWRGSSLPNLPVGPTVINLHQDLFVDEGIEDRGHRRNLLNAGFREVGIGVVTGLFKVEGTDYTAVMTTQDFGATKAQAGPFLVGVAFRDANGDGAYSVGEGLAGLTVTPANGKFYAITSASGGYAIPLTGLSGTVQVSFSGGPLVSPIIKSAALAGQNVKVDFELNADSIPAIGFVASSARFSSPKGFEVDLQGPANARVAVESSDNLTSWSEVGQLTLTGGTSHFTDSSGTPRRFFRARKL